MSRPLVLLVLLACGWGGAIACRGAQTVIVRESFQGVGTLDAANPGNLGAFVSGAWQKRAVGPSTVPTGGPGWSGDAQGVATHCTYDLTTGPANAAQAGGTIGCWVRFVDFANAGYYNNPGSANPALILQVTRADGYPFQNVGVTSTGHLVGVAGGGYAADGGSISANTWYWIQIAWIYDNGGLTIRSSYRPLGGAETVIGTNTDGNPVAVAHLMDQPLYTGFPGQDYRWRGRVGNVTLCAVGAFSDAAIPPDDIAPAAGPFQWYVNPATGDDNNTGSTPGAAWKTTAKLNAEMANAGIFGAAGYATGDTITIDTTAANLLLGQSSLNIDTPGVNVVQLGGGPGGTGEIQAWTTVPAGAWSGPVAQTSHVYQATLSESNPTCVLWENDRWMNHPTGRSFSDVRAALDATPGSFWTDGTTMYVHPSADTQPALDGKDYTRSYLRPGTDGGAAAVEILAPNVRLSGLRVRKTCLADPLTNDPGAAYCYQTQGQLDGVMLVENCFGGHGSKHIFGYTDNSLTRQYVTRNCQAEQGSPYVGAGGQTCWVDYANNAGSNGTATSDYENCTTLANAGLIGSTQGQYRPDIPAWISHNSGQGTMQFSRESFVNCRLAGGLSTAITPQFSYFGGSCRGGAFGPGTNAAISGTEVPGGQVFTGAGTVTVTNCLLAINSIYDGFEAACSGAVTYENCTFDLTNTLTNNDNHVLFSRAGALNFVWRNNVLIGSAQYHFGVLRNAASADSLVFDHNAYDNIQYVVYHYGDGAAAADYPLAQWQALGEDPGSFAASDLKLDAGDFPAPGSPVVDAGGDRGPLADYSGRRFNHRRTIGALEPKSTFARWQADVFTPGEAGAPGVGGMGADPDGDGLSNLLEYALAADPKTADTRDAPALAVQSGGGQSYLTLSYRQLVDAADLTYTPQGSTDLVNWQSGPAAVVPVGSVENGDGTERVTVRDAQPLGAAPRRFLRLQVSVLTANRRSTAGTGLIGTTESSPGSGQSRGR